MLPSGSRHSPRLPLAVSLSGHALLVTVLTLIPSRPSAPPAGVETEVKVGLESPREPRLPPLGPVELQELPAYPVQVAEPLLSEGGPSNPAPRAVGPPTAAPGPAGASPLASPGGHGSLPVLASARSVVYLLDHSASMGIDGALGAGRREVAASLAALRPGTFFQVIPYNRVAEPLLLGGRTGLVALGPSTYEQAVRALAALRPSGSTDHVRALLRGLSLRPDVLFLMTDACDMTLRDVAAVTAFNQRRTTVYAVELTRRLHPRPDSPLQRLAADNRGTCVRIPPAE